MVVLAMRAQVLGELIDALGHERHLDLGPAGVAIRLAELLDQLLLSLLGQRHSPGEGSRARVWPPTPSRTARGPVPRLASSGPPARARSQTAARPAGGSGSPAGRSGRRGPHLDPARR